VTGAARVELVGGDTFARTLRDFGRELDSLTDAHAAAGAVVADAAAQRARRRTGALAGSFAATVADHGVQVGSPLPYAGVQEFGWPRRHITPSRALTSALDASTGRVDQIYTAAVTAAASHVRGM
jgi:hypothetical protein